MSVSEKQAQLCAELSVLKDPQERFAYVVKRGRKSAALDAAFKIPANRLDGCLANVWLVSRVSDGKCYFQIDSDSVLIKGVAVILCEFYSGLTAPEILGCDPGFLKQFGIDQHLTPNRRNSLTRVWDRIRCVAAQAEAG